eukprot:4281507-Pleurochrysis_carterae.AAC.2
MAGPGGFNVAGCACRCRLIPSSYLSASSHGSYAQCLLHACARTLSAKDSMGARTIQNLPNAPTHHRT